MLNFCPNESIFYNIPIYIIREGQLIPNVKKLKTKKKLLSHKYKLYLKTI